MTDTTAKIRAKGCDATGITEEIANAMFETAGPHNLDEPEELDEDLGDDETS